jgi:hypothetical protein
MNKRCFACNEQVCPAMHDCQPCIASNPTYSMRHVFSQAKFKRRHKAYIHDAEALAKRKLEAPFYSGRCEGRTE